MVPKIAELAHSWICKQNGERPGEQAEAEHVEVAPMPALYQPVRQEA